MANTTYYSSYSGTSGSNAAGTSLCPTNWTLPTSGSASKDFGTLLQHYGGTGNEQATITDAGDVISKRFRSFPNNFLYSGIFNAFSANNRGSGGYYWSRSSCRYDYSCALTLDSNHLQPSSSYSKYAGYSVRCLIGS